MDIARTRFATTRIRLASIVLLSSLALWPAAALAEPAIEFEDVTEKLGLAPYLENWELAHGGAWGDVTGNDRPDLYIGAFADRPVYAEDDAPIPNMLLLNQSDGFALSPDATVRFERQRARTSMSLFVDLNNNGKLDLLVGTHGRGPASQLFANQWPDAFRNVTPRGGGWPRNFHMRNATAIDLDRDGLLDLILVDGRYGPGRQGIDAYRNRLVVLRNLGDFQFEDVTEKYGFPSDATPGLGAAIGDVNNNGRLDLFIAHSNRLFISQDDGTYTEYRPGFFHIDGLNLAGSEWPCGAAFADLTGNGLLDLVLTVHADVRRDAQDFPGHVFIWINRGIDENGMPRFEELTHEAGLHMVLPRISKAGIVLKAAQLALVDLDNNGRRDILMGMIREDEQGRTQPVVFRNTGVNANGVPQFEVPPLESIIAYYATAPVADYDRDGRIDIFMATWFHEVTSQLFRNVTDAGNYLVVRVQGKADDLNPMGVGATVRLYEAGHAGDEARFLSRGDITLANGYSVGDEAMAHFGLGERDTCDLVITWQDREVVLRNVAANQYLDVPVE